MIDPCGTPLDTADVQGPVDWPLMLLDGLQTASVVDQCIGCISEGRGLRMAAAK